MMKSYKDRKVKFGGMSEVYFNLHNHLFSIKQDGLVVLHASALLMDNVVFKVSEAGRQRVLKEQKKNVHARVIGNFHDIFDKMDISSYREAYYNPYKTTTFIDKETGEALYKADEVILMNKKIYYK